jgi:PhnB protein
MSETKNQIIPMLAYEDGIAAMDWLCKVFGFSEKTRMLDDNGRLAHGELVLGEGIIMLACPTPDYQSPRHHREICEKAAAWYRVPYIINGLLVYVDDVEAHYKNAKEHGAVILSGLETGGPGLRYRVEDLEGQRWMFMQKS